MTLRRRIYLTEKKISSDLVIKRLKEFADIPNRWSSYLSFEKIETKNQARRALRWFMGIGNKPEVGDFIEAYRATNRRDEYKDLRQGKRIVSRNHISNKLEKGLSVALNLHYAARGYKYVYRVRGKIVGFGSDGESLLVNVSPIGKLKTARSAVNQDMESGPTSQRSQIYINLAKKTGLTTFELIRLARTND